MATAEASGSSLDERSIQSLEATARWIVGASASVAAVLVAGLQIRSLADVGGGWHRWLALFAFALGFAAVIFVIAKASTVLTTPRYSLVALTQLQGEATIRAAEKKRATPNFGDVAKEDPLLEKIYEHRHLLMHDPDLTPHDVNQQLTTAKQSGTTTAPLEESAKRLTDFATLHAVRTRYESLVRWLMAAGAVVAASVVIFASAVASRGDAAVTKPIAVDVYFTASTATLRGAGLSNSCPTQMSGVVVGGTLAEPEVALPESPGCPARHVVVTRELGVAVPRPGGE